MSKIIKLSAGVRYYEDGTINGVDDICFEEQQDGAKPRVPCVELFEEEHHKLSGTYISKEYRWCPIIDVETGIITNWEKGTKARIHYKVCDDCMCELWEDDTLICNNKGYWYCPPFLAIDDDGFGDYIILNVEEDGKIPGWCEAAVDEWAEGQIEYAKKKNEEKKN